jgi:signal peptidase I
VYAIIGHIPMRPVDELGVDLLRRGERLRIKTRGSSMTPFLRDGDTAIVSPTLARNVNVGDVICYEAPPGNLLVHRVIARVANGFLTKGDALTNSERVHHTAVLGTVIAIERDGRLRTLDSRAARRRSRAIAALAPILPHALAAAVRLKRTLRRLRA